MPPHFLYRRRRKRLAWFTAVGAVFEAALRFDVAGVSVDWIYYHGGRWPADRNGGGISAHFFLPTLRFDHENVFGKSLLFCFF